MLRRLLTISYVVVVELEVVPLAIAPVPSKRPHVVVRGVAALGLHVLRVKPTTVVARSVEDAKSEVNKLFQEAWELEQGVEYAGAYADKPAVLKRASEPDP